MRIVQKYSHQNGFEYLMYHKPKIWKEVEQCIAAVDGKSCRTKESAEKTMLGKMLYSPGDLNKCFKEQFEKRRWASHTTPNWLSEHFEDIRELDA